MDWLLDIDWEGMFVPRTAVLEIVIRGSLMYLGIFVLLRFVLKRESGGVGITDILVIVLIADAASNGMTGDYTSITDGMILVAVIIVWAWGLNRLGHRFPPVQRLLRPGPLLLIKDGHMLRKNMSKESLTDGELMSKIREQGVEDISEVGRAYMEDDGQISVIRTEDEAPDDTTRHEL